jgi:hypothetical protein
VYAKGNLKRSRVCDPSLIMYMKKNIKFTASADLNVKINSK